MSHFGCGSGSQAAGGTNALTALLSQTPMNQAQVPYSAPASDPRSARPATVGYDVPPPPPPQPASLRKLAPLPMGGQHIGHAPPPAPMPPQNQTSTDQGLSQELLDLLTGTMTAPRQ